MPRQRTAAMFVVLLALATLPGRALGAATTIPRLSLSPPARLSTGSTPATTTTAAPTGLPRTGDDLRIEVLIAAAMLGAGLALRRRGQTR